MNGEIYLTGGGGHLGGKILRAFLESCHKNITLIGETLGLPKTHRRCDLATFRSQEQFDQDDVLILCGAQYYKGSDVSIIEQMRTYNVDYTLSVLECFLVAGGQYVVYFSSYMQLYCNESNHRPAHYIKTKQLILNYLLSLRQVKLLNLYLYDNWSNDDCREKFVPKLLNALGSHEEFEITYPDTLIDLTEANLLADRIVNLIRERTLGSFSLASARPVTLFELASQVSSNYESRSAIVIGNRHFSEPIPYIETIEMDPCDVCACLVATRIL